MNDKTEMPPILYVLYDGKYVVSETVPDACENVPIYAYVGRSKSTTKYADDDYCLRRNGICGCVKGECRKETSSTTTVGAEVAAAIENAKKEKENIRECIQSGERECAQFLSINDLKALIQAATSSTRCDVPREVEQLTAQLQREREIIESQYAKRCLDCGCVAKWEHIDCLVCTNRRLEKEIAILAADKNKTTIGCNGDCKKKGCTCYVGG